MALNAAEMRALSALLDEMLDLPAAQRLAWIDGRTDLTEPQRAQLRAMAASADDNGADLPELPGYGEVELRALGTEDRNTSDQTPGTTVGPYRLLSELGRGGMGSVWLAERVDGQLKRQVALKLPHNLITQPQLRERLLRERDILAQLNHPHIARLYDAGVTEQGQPFLALEYVQGRMLTDYCQAAALGLKDRLGLFLQVLDAVQYAHGQLVVHRDLKPANMLVTPEGQVRLLDFGIAKLLVDGEAKETELTQLGGRAMTPQYAAPEQILGKAVGIAADVYSLGVVLYELLAGELPYKPTRNSRGALEDAIVETIPVAPSRVTTTAPANVPLRWLRGDLDTIVLKALKKSPHERYATASAFADDLQRYLRGEPVLARPDSAVYRARRFVGRHRWGVAAAATVLLSLAGGLGVAVWQASVARQEARTAVAVKDYLRDIFLANSAQQPNPELARQTTARELLDIGAAKMDAELKDAPRAKLEVLQMIAELYAAVGLHERSVEMMERHLALARVEHGTSSADTVESMLTLVGALWTANQDSPRIGELLLEAEHALDQRRENQGHLRSVQLTLAAEYFAERDITRALAAVRRAVLLSRQTSGDDPANDGAAILVRSAKIEMLARNCPEALASAEEGIRSARSASQLGKAGQGGAVVLGVLFEIQGMARLCAGNSLGAEQSLREAIQASATAFGEKDLEVVRFRGRLASVLLATGQRDKGLAELHAATALLAGVPEGNGSRMHTEALAAVGRAHLDAGNHDTAITLLQRYLKLRASAGASLRVSEVQRDLAQASQVARTLRPPP